jgi:anaerobic magnesium-protoporphyrin IX monomethyl ester cyclase
MPESSGRTGRANVDVLLIEDLGQQRLPARALAAVVRQAGYDTRLAHFGPRSSDGGEDAQAVVALAEALRPRLVIFSILFASLVPEYLALAEALRRAGIGAHISMAGPLPSFVPAELLAACPALDSVLCGEAEAGLAGLVAALNDPARWLPPAGLAYRTPDGAIRQPSSWPAQVASLDTLPFPARDGDLASFRGFGFATVEGSRGCYHSCAFCLPTAFYRATAGRSCYRLRTVRDLVDEIETLTRRGTRLFLFDDEQFLPAQPYRDQRVAQLEHELRRRGLEIAFTIKCRPDDVEERLFEQLRGMGLLRVYVGVESGCQASLDLFGKGVTTRRNVEALATLDRLDVVADFYDLLFHPWSTLDTVASDIAFCRRVAPYLSTPLRFNELGILPGTRLAARLQAEGRCCGEPWLWRYSLGDPRAEVLRRLNRLVLSSATPRLRTERVLTAAWYALLLERRFRPERFDGTAAGGLREAVARLNRDCLGVWSEMLDFARAGAIDDAERVNAAAALWAGQVNAACMRAAEVPAELGLSISETSRPEFVPAC